MRAECLKKVKPEIIHMEKKQQHKTMPSIIGMMRKDLAIYKKPIILYTDSLFMFPLQRTT